MNATFESGKLKIAKQAVSMNTVSSQQVFELVQLFTFESTKLEFAKFAYSRTFDKGNYFVVNNAFTFNSSINALNDYIDSAF